MTLILLTWASYQSHVSLIFSHDTRITLKIFHDPDIILSRASCQSHLSLREVECVCQLNSFWRGEVSLRLEPFLEARQLVVREHGPGLSPSTVLGAQIARPAREKPAETQTCADKQNGWSNSHSWRHLRSEERTQRAVPLVELKVT
jgi:hypothetical protein